MLQLKSVNKLKVIFALKKCCADNKFLEYSGAPAIAYFHSVGFEFLRSQQVQLAIEMPKIYHRNADVRLFKTDNVYQKVDAKQQMLNTVCQNTHAKNQMLINNNETQSRNSRVVALSTHARLRFNSSVTLLLGTFDYCECNKKIVSNYIITTGYFLFSIFFSLLI